MNAKLSSEFSVKVMCRLCMIFWDQIMANAFQTEDEKRIVKVFQKKFLHMVPECGKSWQEHPQ